MAHEHEITGYFAEESLSRTQRGQTEHLAGIYARRERRTDACRVLFCGIEDDAPLWDIPGEVGVPGGLPIERARKIVRRLLNYGFVTIERGPWTAGRNGGPLELEAALAAIARRETWVPSDDAHWIVATAGGRTAYGRHVARRPHHNVGCN
ncbi:MAG: hypothetical protein U0838_15805 [Chloroflexota bacterium]